MTKPGRGAVVYLITAALVGVLLCVSAALMTLCVWNFVLSTDVIGRQIGMVAGMIGVVAAAPAATWAFAFQPWMRARIAEGRRTVVVLGWAIIATWAVLGVVLLIVFEMLD